jgi:hypothetical protein
MAPGVKRTLLYIFGAVLLVGIAVQLVPVERGNPAIETEIVVPVEVRAVLRESCYDCHSNETVWPWYSQVAPASWQVAHDVEEGREHLNFSTWNRYDEREQHHKVEEIWEEIEKGKMPLPKYLRLHPNARLTPEDLATLEGWVRSIVPAEGEEAGGTR